MHYNLMRIIYAGNMISFDARIWPVSSFRYFTIVIMKQSLWCRLKSSGTYLNATIARAIIPHQENVTAGAGNNFTDVYTAEASINVDNRIPRTMKYTYSATMHFPCVHVHQVRAFAWRYIGIFAWACFNEPVRRTPYSIESHSLG